MNKEIKAKRWGEWMCAAQNGDSVAYNSLLQEISHDLRAYFKRRISDSEFVEDLLQDLLLAIHRARHTYDRERPFMPWLYAIARYKLIDYFRFQKKQQDIIMIEDIGHEFFGAALADNDSALKHLHELIQKLSPKQRQVLTYVKIEGLSIRETAEKMQISESAVKVNAHRAYKAIKKLIAESWL